ncbi:MAG: flagellar M-ring protein FliF [Treponema sp.]|jgi:flagellar M-ring protein FliF|nr:flagellar M-ring protein FliF [Treponema sp.]
MGEWFRKVLEQIKNLWGKWSLLQKLILLGICVAAIAGVVVLFSVSASPTMVPVIDTPIVDLDMRDRMVTRINAEGVRASISPAGVVMVGDEETARRMRAILIREDLVPNGTDPWAIFDVTRWTITDMERNVNLQRAITSMVTEHVKSLNEVDDVNVTIAFPKDALFVSEQSPVSASVIITPRPGSDITENPKKIEGIQKLLKFAVTGLKDENIVITDRSGMVLNDFAGMADSERLKTIQQGNKLIQQLEAQYRARVLTALQQTFTADRVRDLNLKIDMDLSKKVVNTEEFLPFTIKPRTPGSSYDDSEIAESVIRSQTSTKTTYTGTGYTPEGPAGVEGQTAPAYRDMSNIYGTVTQENVTTNNEINKSITQEEKSPSIDRITVSVNIDGTWVVKRDEKGKPIVSNGATEREYTPISAEDLRSTQSLIQNAIGYNASRGDSVTVTNIPFDRTQEFAVADTSLSEQQRIRLMLLLIGGGVAFLILAFIAFKAISREIERRKRLAEDERAQREAAIRESAIMQAEEEGAAVSMSVEERTRMELQESIANMSKDHPEDVAQLIRTWLLEE